MNNKKNYTDKQKPTLEEMKEFNLKMRMLQVAKLRVKNKKQQAMPKSEAESFGIKRNPAIRAPRIYLSEEEIIRIMRKEAAIKKKIGNLIDSMLCDDSQISEMDNTKNKTEAFDIDEFV